MGKTGNEAIRFQDQDTGLRLRDFWSWAYSDLLDNTLRGSFSEFLVAAALGIDLSNPRVNWDPWDVTFPTERGELHIEVRAAPTCRHGSRNTPPQSGSASVLPSAGLRIMATSENSAGSPIFMCSVCSQKKTFPKLTL